MDKNDGVPPARIDGWYFAVKVGGGVFVGGFFCGAGAFLRNEGVVFGVYSF